MKSMRIIVKGLLVGLIAGALLSSFTLISCKKEEKVIKIGAILPLTGNLAFLGEGEKNGLLLAKDHLQKTLPGYKIDLIIEDMKGNPKEAVSIANKLISINKVDFLFVSTTASCNAVAPLVDKAGIIMFAMTIDPFITQKSPNIYRVWVNSKQIWDMLSNYILKSGYKKIGLIRVDLEYGLMVKRILEENLKGKVKIVYDEPTKVGDRNYKDLLTRIKNVKVDAIAITEYSNDLVTLVKQMREYGIRTQLLGEVAWSADFVIKELGKLFEGEKDLVFVAPSFILGKNLNPRAQKFVDTYKRKYGKRPSWNEAYPYDAMLVLGEAIRKAGSLNVSKIKRELYNIQDFEGVTGKISMLKTGDAISEMSYLTFEKGKVKKIKGWK